MRRNRRRMFLSALVDEIATHRRISCRVIHLPFISVRATSDFAVILQ
jgi:hypothetical protein